MHRFSAFGPVVAVLVITAGLSDPPRSASACDGDPRFEVLPYEAGFTVQATEEFGDPLAARLAHVVQRAGELAAEDGDTLLPQGTRLESLAFDHRNVALIELVAPADGGAATFEPIHIAAIERVLSRALEDRSDLAGLHIRLRMGDGPSWPLEDYGPIIAPFPPDSRTSDDTGMTAAQGLQYRTAAEQPGDAQIAGIGGPVGNADGQPTGALSGVVIFVQAGHGWTSGTSSWFLQRPVLLDMNEDYGNLDQINFVVNYLFNAGATVVPYRPIGHQSIEVVLDNDDPGVTFTGTWNNSSTSGGYYENGKTNSGIPYKWINTTTTETATARYTPTIPTSDFYPVYCWTKDDTDRVRQTYRIRHSGGTAAVAIDHQIIGQGWIWLGTYHFQAGTGGYVEITNQSSQTGVVIADAIRFGSGVGDVVGSGPGRVSGYPRDEEASRYWAESEAGFNAVGLPSSIWNCCTTDQNDNVGTAARWARHMNRTNINNDRWRRAYVEFHTNAAGCGTPPCTAKGTSAHISDSNPTTNQVQFATVLGNRIRDEMQLIDSAEFEFTWGNRSTPRYGGLGAISTTNNGNEYDATLIEVAFHDNDEDAKNLRSAKVRNAVARATCHGIVQFLSNSSTFPGTQVPNVWLPEPPENVRAVHNGSGGVVVSWTAPPTGGANGHAATGYKIYRSTNGYGFGQARVVGNVLTSTFTDVSAGSTVYFRVAATNAGGESMPSETLAVHRAAAGASQVLIVNGYDRVSRFQSVVQSLPAGPIERPIPRRVNSFDYVIQHATALAEANATFDSCANEAVIANQINLANYDAVVWICGQESTVDRTFDATEQSRLTSYLNGGGRLFATGAEIGWDLDFRTNGVSFYENTLRANYVEDDAGTYSVTGAGGILSDVGNFNFNPAQGAPYHAAYPDRIAPQSGATTVLNYVGGTGGGAGIQYDSGTYRVVVFGFPFETITSATARRAIMQRVMNWMLPDAPSCVPVTFADFEGYQPGDTAMFLFPRYSGSTAAHLALSPNITEVANVSAFGGTRVLRAEWAFIDTQPQRWMRLTTADAPNIPNPAVDLTRPIRLRVRLNSPGSLRVCLGIRETGTDVAIGQDGGRTGPLEWLGATSVTNSAPQGTLVSHNSGQWHTLEFDPRFDPVTTFTGDGVLDAPNDKGVLEHVAFAIVDGAGPFSVDLDVFEQPCPEAIAPPTITQHPQAQPVCPAASASFSVTASGSGTLGYQWQKNSGNLSNGGRISGADTATLQISNVQAGDAGNYRCVVTNLGGSSTSNAAALTVKAATTITLQPLTQTVDPGATASLAVSATGAGALAYQWRHGGIDLTNGGRVSGAQTANLLITGFGSVDEGDYRCNVSADCGSALSQIATLTLSGPPPVPGDFDGDGDVDLDDFAFLQRCLSGSGTPVHTPECDDADLDSDNDVDANDVWVFVNCFSGADVPGDPDCLE